MAMNNQQRLVRRSLGAGRAVWVAVVLILVVLGIATIVQARAISRDSRRTANLERQVEEDRWQAEEQRRRDKAEREDAKWVEEWERWNQERQRERGW